jgi:hypothetical protein
MNKKIQPLVEVAVLKYSKKKIGCENFAQM